MKYTLTALSFILFVVLVFILVFMLCGCSTSQPTIVQVPIPLPPSKIALPPEPKLPIRTLNAQSTPAQVAKAYVASINVLSADDKAIRAMWIAEHQLSYFILATYQPIPNDRPIRSMLIISISSIIPVIIIVPMCCYPLSVVYQLHLPSSHQHLLLDDLLKLWPLEQE